MKNQQKITFILDVILFMIAIGIWVTSGVKPALMYVGIVLIIEGILFLLIRLGKIKLK